MRTTLTLILAMSLFGCTSVTEPAQNRIPAPKKAAYSGFTISAGRNGGVVCVDTETGQEVPMENCI